MNTTPTTITQELAAFRERHPAQVDAPAIETDPVKERNYWLRRLAWDTKATRMVAHFESKIGGAS